MFLSISLYFIFLFLIWWAFCGYLYVIYLLSLFKGEDKNASASMVKSYPFISILVPCYNEENLVEQKVDNLKQINYPKDKFEVYFLDGLSSDTTYDKLTKLIKDSSNMKVLQTNCKGKINQINFILPTLKSDIVLNTDMDAIMEPDTVQELIKEFEKDTDIYVVGAYVAPQNCINMEKHYWETQNLQRVLESKIYSASAVMAPCYAFKRELLSKFPEDCVADDIYISYLANSLQKKTKYCDTTIVYETRCPNTIETLIQHKFRKANAYIMELLRFSYLLPKMSNKWKIIYTTKMLQILFIPWILVFFALSSISFLLSNPGTVKIAIFAFMFLLISFVLAHYFVEKGRKQLEKSKYEKRSSIAVFLLTTLVLFFAGITYPFFSQTSNYKKI